MFDAWAGGDARATFPAASTRPVFRVEYLRRIDGGINYLPQTSTSLEAGDWEPIPGIPQTTPINTSWERVIHEIPSMAERMFGRVGVELGP